MLFFVHENMYSLLFILCGIVPAMLLIYIVYRWWGQMLYGPWQRYLLIIILGFVAALPAYYIQRSIESNFDPDHQYWIDTIFISFCAVSMVEEIFKLLAVWCAVRCLSVPRGVDLLFISLVVSMGFAGVENILYSQDKGWQVALFRSFTAVPAHACFSLMMVYFSAMQGPPFRSWLPYIQGWIVTVCMHGLYDWFILQELSEPLLLGSLVVLGFCLFLAYQIQRRVRLLSESIG